MSSHHGQLETREFAQPPLSQFLLSVLEHDMLVDQHEAWPRMCQSFGLWIIQPRSRSAAENGGSNGTHPWI